MVCGVCGRLAKVHFKLQLTTLCHLGKPGKHLERRRWEGVMPNTTERRTVLDLARTHRHRPSVKVVYHDGSGLTWMDRGPATAPLPV